MRRIFLTEKNVSYIYLHNLLFHDMKINEDYNPFKQNIEKRKEYLRNWVETFGTMMQDTETGQMYVVAKIPNIEKIFGTTYCACRALDDDTRHPIGQVIIKPIESFGSLY